jgi:hypothetical protein
VPCVDLQSQEAIAVMMLEVNDTMWGYEQDLYIYKIIKCWNENHL